MIIPQSNLELQLITNFIGILVNFELFAYFFTQRKRVEGKSSTWAETFTIFFIFTGVFNLIQFIFILVYQSDPIASSITSFWTAFALNSACGIILHLSRPYIKISNKILGKLMLVAEILNICILGLNILSAVLTGELIINMPVLGLLALIVIFIIPFYLGLKTIPRVQKV